MAAPDIEALARELTDADWHQVFTEDGGGSDDVGVCLTYEQWEAVLAYVRELAAALNSHQRSELAIQMRGCTDASPAECDRRVADALVRRGLAAPTSLRGPRHWLMFAPTPLGHAVLRVLEDDRA